MNKVEFHTDKKTGLSQFGRINRFYFADSSDDQLTLAEQFAEQSTAQGWPVNFIESLNDGLLPVLRFEMGLHGLVRYFVEDWKAPDDQPKAEIKPTKSG